MHACYCQQGCALSSSLPALPPPQPPPKNVNYWYTPGGSEATLSVHQTCVRKPCTLHALADDTGHCKKVGVGATQMRRNY